jgi:DNA polymerase-3 subunit delta'
VAFLAEEALQYLVNAHRTERMPHSLLVSGEEGSGKRRVVEGFFTAVNERAFHRLHPDFHEIEPESKSRRILVEQVRRLDNALHMKAANAPWKFGLISDADRLMPQAANAFLKTLEEPPAHSVLFLTTALPEALLDTIRSRCVHLPLRRGAPRDLEPEAVAVLDHVAAYWTAGKLTVAGSLVLARRFQDELGRLRERIEDEHEAQFKREQESYVKTTDGAWLEDEQERLTTLTESRYVKGRTWLLFRIVELFGDALRAAYTDAEGSLGRYRLTAAALGAALPAAELLERMQAIEKLQDHLSRNVQEALAIEVAFLRAFGPALVALKATPRPITQ